jgi:putative spermidine/putrescine transport system permease protein
MKGWRLMNKKWAYILMVPGLTIIAVFLIVPLINSIIPTIFNGTSLSLKLYLDFFKDEYNSQIFLRTLRISIATVVVCAVLGVPTAYFVSKTNKKIRGILIACTIFPLLTNSVVRSFAWITILGKNGVLNKVLLALNLISEPQKFLYTEFAVIIGSVYLFLPLMITSLVGVMENIENELLEAAESLGANKITAVFKIVFPLSVPGLIVGSVLVFAGDLCIHYSTDAWGK